MVLNMDININASIKTLGRFDEKRGGHVNGKELLHNISFLDLFLLLATSVLCFVDFPEHLLGSCGNFFVTSLSLYCFFFCYNCSV